jgi:hypothetical protein
MPPRLILALCLAALAGAAQAATPDALKAAVFQGGAARPARAAAVTYAAAPQALPDGIAKTSLDHAFDKRATGQVGFLCGLDERADAKGAMAAYGSDPHGRFVGAKLSFTFR